MTATGSALALFLTAALLPSALLTGQRQPTTTGQGEAAGVWLVRWDRGFQRLQPVILPGRLNLSRKDGRWVGDLRFEQLGPPLVLQSMQADAPPFVATFADTDGRRAELRAWIHDGSRLLGELRTTHGQQSVPWSPLGGRRAADSALLPFAHGDSLPRGTPEEAGLDAAALARLFAHAERERSTALVIVKDGKIVVERYRGDPQNVGAISAMSASKSVVALAIARLLADGKLTLDSQLGSLLPDVPDDKRDITVRQLLNHTSGIDPTRALIDGETIRQHCLASKLQSPPGLRFLYNNNAVDLLAVVVRQVAGVHLDTFLQQRFFTKMDIADAEWAKDSEGTPLSAGELRIRPVDLAKLGQLMLDRGTWHGEQLLPAEHVEQLVAQGQPFVGNSGLLWWREGRFVPMLTEPILDQWRAADVDALVIARARMIADKPYPNWNTYLRALRGAIGEAELQRLQQTDLHGSRLRLFASTAATPPHGYSARGWLGQFLVVLPEHNLVAVRMRRAEGSDYRRQGDSEFAWRGFPDEVHSLVGTGR